MQWLSKQILKEYVPSSFVAQKLKEIFAKHNRFILSTHVHSDADGIGSQLAFATLLKKLNKEVEIINCELPSRDFAFLQGHEQIQSIENLSLSQEQIIERFKSSYVILLDSSELKRSEKVGDYIRLAGSSWISLDHHDIPNKENNMYSDASYASTTELVWDLFHFFNIPISLSTGEALYLGLVSDSGNFRYGKTSTRTHLAAAELLALGISSEKFYRLLFESHPFDRLPFLRNIFQHTEFDKKNGLVFAQIKPAYKEGLNLGENISEGIVNYFLAVEEVFIAALATETEEGFLKCSLRSIDNVDVASIARKFGGGGHRNAAGLFVREDFNSAKEKLKKEIYLYLEAYTKG